MSQENSHDDQTRSHFHLAQGTAVKHYRIVRMLGAGGMGEVYLADDTQLERRVALKFLALQYVAHEEMKARFLREAQAAAVLDHPNIVTIYEVGEFRDRPFIAMQYVDGPALKELLTAKRPALKRGVDLAIQLCEGLDRAHQVGIVHRDIKPSNIAIDDDGRPLLLDFGLAAVRGAEQLTRTGYVMGTMGYMSPESIRGEESDYRSDIFSLGVVLYEMFTGQSPFRGENDAVMMNAVLNTEPPPISEIDPDLPGDLEIIIDKALDKDLETRYQTVADLLADLKRLKKQLEPGASVVRSRSMIAARPAGGRALRRVAAGSTIVAVLAVLVLILGPWDLRIGKSEGVLAAENRLAIMYFDNLADPKGPEALGEIVTSLLITDLSESHYVQVVSSQRLHDILKQLGRGDTKHVDRDIASRVAKRAHAKWMLLGKIYQTIPHYVISTEMVDVVTGDVVAAQQIEGQPGEEIFGLVDKLTVEIKADLSLPAGAQTEFDPNIADVTTHSPTAYRHYLEGLEYESKLDYDNAERSFRQALAQDSTFAMAYYWLAWFVDRSLIDKAVQYSDKVSQKERMYIQYLQARLGGDMATAAERLLKIVERYPDEKEAYYWLGNMTYHNLRDFEQAVTYLESAVELDSTYKEAYNILAYAYNDLGNLEKSIWAINRYILLAPNDANPYDSRGDLYAFNGKLTEAVASYREALERRPDFFLSRTKLGYMYMFAEDYARAESCFTRLSSSADAFHRSEGRTYLAVIKMYQGRFEEALEFLENGLAADALEDAKARWNAEKHRLRACLLREREELAAAVREAQACVDIRLAAYPNDPVNTRDFCVCVLLEEGRVEEADSVANEMKRGLDSLGRTLVRPYLQAKGSIALARGDTTAAITLFEQALDESTMPPFMLSYQLAGTYLATARLDLAVELLESALNRFDESRALAPIQSVKAHYLLGRAYEESGWVHKAVGQYEVFLRIWNEADGGLTEVTEARERLKRLSS